MNTSNVTSSEYFTYIISVTIASLSIIICIFGITLNCISFFVFLQKYFRSISINLLLASLSLFDMCFLILAVPVYNSFPLMRMFPKLLVFSSFCTIYLYPLTLIFHCASVWLLIPITFERWIAVCRPMFVTRYCTRKGAIISVLIIFLLSITYNFCRFWDFRFNQNGMVKLLLRKYRPYVLWYVTISQLLLIYIIPLTFITSFNYVIRAQIILSERTRLQMTSTEQCANKTARMLLYIVFAFISCYSLSLVLNLIEIMDPYFLVEKVGQTFIYLNNMLVVTNASLTAVIYYKFSTRYRLGVKLMLSRIFLPRFYQHLLSMPSTHRELSIFTPSSIPSINSLSRCRLYTPSLPTSTSRSSRSNTRSSGTSSTSPRSRMSVSSEPRKQVTTNPEYDAKKDEKAFRTRCVSLSATTSRKKNSLRTMTLKKETQNNSASSLYQLNEITCMPLGSPNKSTEESEENL